MNAKSRRQVGGYIWREEMGNIYRAIDDIRRLIDNLIEATARRPIPVSMILSYVAQMASRLNAALAALRELEKIADETVSEDDGHGQSR